MGMGGEPRVCYLTGSMEALIDKLTGLEDRPALVEELLRELVLLKEGFCDKLALNGRRETVAQARVWMKHVRELVFDIQDWVDEKPEITVADPSRREEVASFKTRIQEARERCTRYRLLREGLDHSDASTEDHLSKLIQDLDSLKKDILELEEEQQGHSQVGAWHLQARELVHTVTEWIDDNPANDDMGRIVTRHFKTQIQRERALHCASCRLPAMLVEPQGHLDRSHHLVDGDAIGKFVEHLANERDRFRKVVSIVGKEGIGKTTLAKEAYAKLGGKFQCRAFVTAGQSRSIKAILMDIFRQVKPQATISDDWTGPPDVRQVITKLRNHLGMMRYFILIDDIRSTYAWKVISSALPDKNHGSRVLTTTCSVEVANTCSLCPTDVVQEMLGLRLGASVSLFDREAQRASRSLFDTEEEMTVNNEILRICSGMPLAITVAAGLLSRFPVLEEPEILQKYILSALEQFSTSEEMKIVLHISCAALPPPVKSCFLYLSIFPEHYTIKKDHLIRLWIAEGFISRRYKERRDGEIVDEAGIWEESMWGRGERYFNELISRGLIQPVFGFEDDQAVGCTVHGVILDFIRSMSSKENFVTVGADLGSGPLPRIIDAIRRFSLDCRDNGDNADTLASRTPCLSSMRSLAVFGDTEWTPVPTDFEDSEVKPDLGNTEVVSVLNSFTFLRVLDLEDTGNFRSHHLKGIGGLILLRYMRLGGAGIHELPEEIGKLEHLETLDVRQTNLKTLPASIVGLKMLVNLLIDSAVELSSNILEMQGLEEVSVIGVSSSKSLYEVIGLLRGSQRLRVLGLSLDRLGQSGDSKRAIFSFFMEVANSTLESLSLHCIHGGLHGQLPVSYKNQMRRFEMVFTGPRRDVPWMASHATHLEIELCDLKEEAIRLLGMASHLRFLKLVSSGNGGRRKQRTIRCLSEEAFPCLQVLWFACKDGGTQLVFEPLVMRQLQRLRLDFMAREMITMCRSDGFGIKNLRGLVQVHVTIDCEGATVSEVEDVESTIRSEVDYARKAQMFTKTKGEGKFLLHYQVPTLEISREHEHKMVESEGSKKRIGPLKNMKNLFTSSVPRIKTAS